MIVFFIPHPFSYFVLKVQTQGTSGTPSALANFLWLRELKPSVYSVSGFKLTLIVSFVIVESNSGVPTIFGHPSPVSDTRPCIGRSKHTIISPRFGSTSFAPSAGVTLTSFGAFPLGVRPHFLMF